MHFLNEVMMHCIGKILFHSNVSGVHEDKIVVVLEHDMMCTTLLTQNCIIKMKPLQILEVFVFYLLLDFLSINTSGTNEGSNITARS